MCVGNEHTCWRWWCRSKKIIKKWEILRKIKMKGHQKRRETTKRCQEPSRGVRKRIKVRLTVFLSNWWIIFHPSLMRHAYKIDYILCLSIFIVMGLSTCNGPFITWNPFINFMSNEFNTPYIMPYIIFKMHQVTPHEYQSPWVNCAH